MSTDEFNAGKGKKTILPFEERLEVVKSIRYVDAVIPETSWEQKTDDVRRLEIAVFTMGDDWVGKFDFLKPHCEVVYLPRTPDISSTGLKAELDRLRAVRGGGAGGFGKPERCDRRVGQDRAFEVAERARLDAGGGSEGRGWLGYFRICCSHARGARGCR